MYIWHFLICCFIKIGQQLSPVRRNKNIQTMYPIYPRYIQDIRHKYKIPSGPGIGPGRAGPVAAGYFVAI